MGGVDLLVLWLSQRLPDIGEGKLMRELPLPQELSRFAHLPDLQYRGNGEWSSACPVCGGTGKRHDRSDRFRLFAADAKGNARAWCRQCSFFEWADAESNQRPDPVQIQQARDLREALLKAENDRLRNRIKELQEQAYWRGYHDSMREGQRALWRMAGIPDDWQDFWQLGYVDQYSQAIPSPAMTIPYFAPDWQAQTIQYRLTNPPEPSDKYRFQAGLKAGAWLADPTEKPSGAALLMEGMKKAAVTFINTTASGNGRFSVVAVPSKTPGADMLDILADCDPVYICLDPDAYQPTRTKDGKILPPAVNRIVKLVGKERARLVKLPTKADDFFTMYKGTAVDFMSFFGQAAKV